MFVSTGIINTQQLEECRRIAQESGATIEHCLLEKKYATPQTIAQAYATYASLDYVNAITDNMADLTILGRIPLKFLRDHSVMPVMINGKLTILTSNPLDFQPLDEINLLLGGGARYAVGAQPMIIDAINRYYPLEGTKQMIEELAEEEGIEAVDFEEIEEKDILAMAS